MRFSRGVVKIPIKFLYAFLIVTFTSLTLYAYVLRYQRSGRRGQCRVLPPPLPPPRPRPIPGRFPQSHPACWREPLVTRFEECPHCFRPNVQNMSVLLTQVQYSTSMFPRGPPDLFKPKPQVQQEFIADYLITPSSVCVATCPYLVAVVLSVADDFDQRLTIRATWASAAKTRVWPHAYMNADVQVVFVLAHQTSSSHIDLNKPQNPETAQQDAESYPTVREWSRIATEAERYGDVLYLNMQDSYYNLTLKLLSAFKWVGDHCPRSRFFLKVDVDTFVNLPLMLDVLIYSEERLEYAIVGKMYTQERIVRRSQRWAVDPKIYPAASFPVYASGVAYILSSRLLYRLMDLASHMDMNSVLRRLDSSNQTEVGALFLSGVLGLTLSFDYFTVPTGVWTRGSESDWFYCDMVHDQKMLGRIGQDQAPLKLWRSFFRFYGKCWKEIAELANPRNY